MFFRNESDETLDVDCLQLEDGGGGTQSFRATVFSWCLAMTPTLGASGGGKRSLSFEATASRLASLPCVDVAGEIEVSGERAPPPLLANRWGRVPDNIEGYAALDLNDEGHTQFRLNLFCTETCFERLARTFPAAFSASGSSIVLEVELDYPGHKDPSFWLTQWQIRTLQVLKWTVRTGAQRARLAR